jgi:hypothetical protein
MLSAAPVAAQDALPESPPELKDFRLDTPQPREEAPPPKADPPKAEPPVQPQPQAESQTQSPRVQQQPRPATPQRTAPRADNSEAGTEATVDAPITAEPVLAAPPADAAPAAKAMAGDEGPATDWRSLMHLWPLLAAALALLAGFGLFRLLRKRTAQEALALAEAPAPMPARKPAQPPKPKLEPAVQLSARFDPGNAQLSLANLTITGQLHLHYEGVEPIERLSMRTAIMSACDGQAALIDAFHRDDQQGDREALGQIVPGEHISVKLELKVPREALQAFDWRERRFVAPIVLVHIASDDAAIAPCRLACVVGQVGDPESPRLTPIPIDRGPKRFPAVQFQPIAA